MKKWLVRNIDTLGRIVLPIEMRRSMDIEPGDPVEMIIQKNGLLVRKYHPGCVFCDRESNLIPYHGKLVCKSCAKKLNASHEE